MGGEIKRFKDEHELLLDRLKNLNLRGITTTGGKEELDRFNQFFRQHNKNERNIMCDILNEECTKDPIFKESFTNINENLNDLEKELSDILNDLESETDKTSEAASLFGEFIPNLSLQLKREEAILHRRFQRIRYLDETDM